MAASMTQTIDRMAEQAQRALDQFLGMDQAQIDHIVAKASVAALDQHGVLAKAAVDETQRGCFEDKATKNLFACEHVVHYLKGQKTVGIIREDVVEGLTEIAEPVGVICGITPVTNPTSTTIFKCLISLKTRNPIIFSFHPSAQHCSALAAQVVRDAAVAAGAPEHCIQWIETPSLEASNYLMHHDAVATILATGGNAMVRAAYSCGKPALGVGAGNVPAYIAEDADIAQAVNDIMLSKSFDNGMICASEQSVIVDRHVDAEVRQRMTKYGGYFLNKRDKKKLEQYLFQLEGKQKKDAVLRPSVVGQPAVVIAREAGIEVPEDTRILLAECAQVGIDEPLTREKLSPVLAYLVAEDVDQGLSFAHDAVHFNGLGHSAAIHTRDEGLAKRFAHAVEAMRIIWNAPSTFGGIGSVYNAFVPSLTLGCGSYGHNSVGGNVNVINLLNIKRLGRRNNNMQWFKVPPKIYFERNSVQYLRVMDNLRRVFIVTDRSMVNLGFVNRVLDQLAKRNEPVLTEVFSDVEPDPSIGTVRKGTEAMNRFAPDTIIALGGGSVMDAAKGMWVFFEHPEVSFDDLHQKFMDIRKRAFTYPSMGTKTKLVCIPTTSGTGSEVTPFAVISDPENHKKYPLADYALTPSVAIVDAAFTDNLPPVVTADSGLDVLSHATEAYVSTLANDYTDGLCLQAIRHVFNYLPRCVKQGNKDPEAREKMHNASTIAGMAFGNAFLGINHSLAHKVGGIWHLPHGRIIAILMPHVIRYNGAQVQKPGMWPKYNVWKADRRYQELAQMLGLPAETPQQGVESYARACQQLAKTCGVAMSFKAQGIEEQDFLNRLEEVAMLAYEDQCTPSNPRLAEVSGMMEILRKAYVGEEE